MDEDEKLAEEVSRKGITDEDIETCRSMDAVRRLEEKARVAESRLAQAAADNDQEMSRKQKEACMADIIKYRTVEALFAREADPQHNQELQNVEKELDERMEATMLAPRLLTTWSL